MKKLLAILSVVLFANQASAEQVKLETGDVYFCVSKTDIKIYADQVKGKDLKFQDPTRFSIKVGDKYLTMKNKNGIESELPIVSRTEKDIHVGSSHGHFMFSLTVHTSGKIYYSSALVHKHIASMGTGDCDKF